MYNHLLHLLFVKFSIFHVFCYNSRFLFSSLLPILYSHSSFPCWHPFLIGPFGSDHSIVNLLWISFTFSFSILIDSLFVGSVSLVDQVFGIYVQNVKTPCHSSGHIDLHLLTFLLNILHSSLFIVPLLLLVYPTILCDLPRPKMGIILPFTNLQCFCSLLW